MIKALKERKKRKLAHSPGVVQFVVFKKLIRANLFQINFTNDIYGWHLVELLQCLASTTRHQPMNILIIAYIDI